MWLIKWIVGILLILVILGFALQNQHQVVQVNVGNWVSSEMPLYFVIYISFALGMVTSILFALVKVYQLKMENRKTKRERDELKEEILKLRNLSIDEETSALPKPAPKNADAAKES
ncbi:hypothetical protein BMS3Abin05_02066 [bacterium BMS3Abin05]|nr:hypothetical protein BMS3Abin05_02066 [bacterium BMS3Abin05]GBE27512.1 hypothetical protein BMS3Bbin03_01439 [bacterium BMS3Bbin03]HDL78934.1 LapA family protein [Bacteroidota bacterium]HDZ12489.1 LapA family protein [Bacteroidota bacterium]